MTEPRHLVRARVRAQIAGDDAYRALPSDATDAERQAAGAEAFHRSLWLDYEAELEAIACADRKRARKNLERVRMCQGQP